MLGNNFLSLLVSPSDRKSVDSSDKQRDIQLSANTIMEGHMSRQDFFRKLKMGLNSDQEFRIWSFMKGRYPHWFVKADPNIRSSGEGLLKQEYFTKFSAAISSNKKK